ncbi:MAG TPA: shikimate dehydrogenase [Defluviitaleaceae bacterium]|nr:shikimate dehydrogenase [Defluviitaleaceae bacterium]
MTLVDMVNGTTNVYGLIGSPVVHTLSPLIHNSLNKILNNNNVYVAFDVNARELEDALKGAYALNIQGINVTYPYKEAVMPYLVAIDDYGKQIGAVNTLKKTNEGYIGYNTDAWGLLMSLKEEKIEIENKSILIIGAGGAAKASAMAITSLSAKKLYISNRTIKRARDLADAVSHYYNLPIELLPLEDINKIDNVDICLQTTSLGMHPQEGQSPINDDDFFHKITSAVDIIYNPWESLFLKKAKKAGCKTVNGFGMLFYQAVKAYEIWTQKEISKENLTALYKSLKNKLML